MSCVAAELNGLRTEVRQLRSEVMAAAAAPLSSKSIVFKPEVSDEDVAALKQDA